jgi:hypothetical protein
MLGLFACNDFSSLLAGVCSFSHDRDRDMQKAANTCKKRGKKFRFETNFVGLGFRV